MQSKIPAEQKCQEFFSRAISKRFRLGLVLVAFWYNCIIHECCLFSLEFCFCTILSIGVEPMELERVLEGGGCAAEEGSFGPKSSDNLPCEAIEAVTPSFMPKNRTKSLVFISSSTSSSSSASSTTTMSLKSKNH